MGVVHRGVVTRMAALCSLKKGADLMATDARVLRTWSPAADAGGEGVFGVVPGASGVCHGACADQML